MTNKTRRRAVILGFALLGFAGSAVSVPVPRSTGIAFYSGKQGVSCNTCHSGGLTPTVELNGPTSLQPGETGRYEVRVTRAGLQQDEAGIGVAADDGTFTPAGGDTRVTSGELVHSMSKPVDGSGTASFEFDWTAPANGGAITMYAAGNSVNGNGSTQGDAHAETMLVIDVEPPCQVTFTEFGTGLAGTGGFVPEMTGTDGDCTGSWSFEIDKVLGGAPGVMWIGFGQDTIPAFGGEFYVDLTQPYLILALTASGPAGTPGAGGAVFGGVDVSAFAGVTLYLQGTFLDAGAVDNISLTNGLELVIG